MFKDQLLRSLALGLGLAGALIMGAAARFGIDGIPVAMTMGAACFLMFSGALQGALVGLCVAMAGAGLLGGALAQLGAAIPVWLFVAGLVMTMAGLAGRILRPRY